MREIKIRAMPIHALVLDSNLKTTRAVKKINSVCRIKAVPSSPIVHRMSGDVCEYTKGIFNIQATIM